MNYKKKILNSFNNGADQYDSFADIQILAGKLLMKNVLNKIGKKSISNIVELGSGTGIYTKMLLENLNFKNLLSYDISPKMVNKARRKFNNFNINRLKNNSKVKFVEQDFDKIDSFEKCNFITSNMSLHWSIDIFKVLDKIFNTSKSGTIFCFTFPNNKSFKQLEKIQSKAHHKISLNQLPSHEILLKYIKKTQKNIFSEEIEYFVKFTNIFEFLNKLKVIGVGAKLYNSKNNFFFLRNLKKRFRVSYYISCFIVFINERN